MIVRFLGFLRISHCCLAVLVSLVYQPAFAQNDIAWIRGGHSDVLLQSAVSPDGRVVAVASLDGTISLWDATTWNITGKLIGHQKGVTSVAFSPDGGTLVSGSLDSTLRLWDVGSRTIRRVINDSAGVNFVSYAGDGSHLVTLRNDWTIRFRDLVTDNVNTTAHSLGESVTMPVLSHDGTFLLLGSDYEDTVRLWNVVTEKEVQHFVGDRIGHAMAFSPDGRTIATSNGNSNLLIWNVASGRVVDSIGSAIWPEQLLYSSGGDSVIAVASDRIEIWSLSERRMVRTIGPLFPRVTSMLDGYRPSMQPARLLPDGKELLIVSYDVYGGSYRRRRPFLDIYDLGTGTIQLSIVAHSKPVSGLAFVGNAVFSCASWSGEIRRWRSDGVQLQPSDLSGDDFLIELSPDGRFASEMSGSMETNFTMDVKDFESWRQVGTVLPFADRLAPASVAPGGNYVYVEGKLMHLSAVTSKYEAVSFTSQTGYSYRLFSFDATRLAGIGLTDVILQNILTSAIEQRLPVNAQPTVLAFSRDDAQLAAGNVDGTITVWNEQSGVIRKNLVGHRGKVNALTFSPNGRFLISAGEDSTVRIWNLDNGATEHLYQGYPSPQVSVALSPDGKFIASGTSDGTVIMWQAHGGLVGVDQEEEMADSRFSLTVYPSPGTGRATISFMLTRTEPVTVSLYTHDGCRVAQLAAGVIEPGRHSIDWSGGDLPSGIYLCRLEAGRWSTTAQFIVVH
jgi:WD40 repeat protein